MTPRDREQWAQDNKVLAAVGTQLGDQNTRVKVRLPRALADAAVRAWQRDFEPDNDHPAGTHESPEQRLVRHRAGSLALIGLAIESRGLYLDEQVEVELEAWFVGHALDAADDAGLL